MLKRWMHKRERYFAFLNDNRIVHPFGWGMEFVKKNANGDDPREVFCEYTKTVLADSDKFFHLPEISDYKLQNPTQDSRLKTQDLSWTSTIKTASPENNTAYAKFFPHEKDKKAAVVILPHWNAKAGSYFDLCKVFNKVGVSALRLTLPYHEERMPPELERADYLVAPNVGRTCNL